MYVDCGVRLPTPAVAGTVSASLRECVCPECDSLVPGRAVGTCIEDMQGACACVVGGVPTRRTAGRDSHVASASPTYRLAAPPAPVSGRGAVQLAPLLPLWTYEKAV